MGSQATVLIVRDEADAGLASSVKVILEDSHKSRLGLLRVTESCGRGGESLREICRLAQPELIIILEPNPSQCSGIALLHKLHPRSPMLVILPENRVSEAVQFLEAGASDFILSPVRPRELIPRVSHLLRPHESDDALIAHLRQAVGTKQIIGQSPVLLAQLQKIPLIAGCDATVLISGETGTGKELCARAVHYLSRRANNPFLPVDCGAIPLDLLENEFFGHERGAYTTAVTRQRGLIEEAAGGSLLLDEIDSLPMPMQVKLLRFLQEKEYRAVGSTLVRSADVRVMAASNTSLKEAVSAGRFRQDLFYRLNVLSLVMPPLRDRREDIPLLARHFLEKYAGEFSRPARDISEQALARLLTYSFPGNARELENLIQRAVLACDGPVVDTRHLELQDEEEHKVSLSYQSRKNLMVTQWERDELKKMLSIHQGNISAIAKAEGKDASAFRALLRKHHLRPTRASPYWDVRV